MNDEIQAAQQAITDAEADLENLRQRVVEGDTTITATQLAERQGAIEFAKLQLQAAQRRQRLAVEKDREAQADEFRAQVEAYIDTCDARLTRTFVQAVRAVSAAVDAMRAHRSTLAQLHRESARVGALFPPIFDGRTTNHPQVRGIATDGERGLYVRDIRRGAASAPVHEVAFAIAAAALAPEDTFGLGLDLGVGAGSVVRAMPTLMERIDDVAERPSAKAASLLAHPSNPGLLAAVRAVALAEDPDDGPADEQP